MDHLCGIPSQGPKYFEIKYNLCTEFCMVRKGLTFSANILLMGNKDLRPLISCLEQEKLQEVIVSCFPSGTISKNIVFVNEIAHELNLGV